MTELRIYSIIICMGQGIIIINPYEIPKESVFQAQRLKEEFEKKNVSVEIVTDTFLHSKIQDGKISSYLQNIDFLSNLLQ